jgi:hypothetical protein
MMSSSGSGAMAVLLSERRFSGGEGRGGWGGSGPWSGVGARRLEMPSSGVLRLRFIGIFLSSSPRDPSAPCDGDRTEPDIALPIIRRKNGKLDGYHLDG